MLAILTYIFRCLGVTGQQLLILLGPLLLLASILQVLSSYLCRRAAAIFGGNVYVWLTAPGVMIHETGHALFCVVFRHRIVEMKLFSPDQRTLGYVKHSYNPRSLYQSIGNFFIGTGPIWLGSAIVLLASRLLLGASIFGNPTVPHGALVSGYGTAQLVQHVAAASIHGLANLIAGMHWTSWRFWLFAYLVICIGSHITLSPPDIHGAWQGLLTLVVALALFNLATLWLAPQGLLSICQQVLRASVQLYAALGLVIALNCVLAFLAWFALRRW